MDICFMTEEALEISGTSSNKGTKSKQFEEALHRQEY